MKRFTALVLTLIMMLSLCSCGGQEPEQNGAETESGTGEQEIIIGQEIGRSSVRLNEYDLRDIYSPPEGNITAMLIPIHVKGFPEYDDAFYSTIDAAMTTGDGNLLMGVKDYFLNASYGKLSIDYEIMPVYTPDMTMDEFYGRIGYNDFFMEIYLYALNHYDGDLGKFDSNGDGLADLVIFISEENRHFSYEATLGSWEFEELCGRTELPYRNCVSVGKDDFWITDDAEYQNMVLIHEISHMFGIMDYYDYNNQYCYVSFDMQEHVAQGDWNPYSKLSVGWVEPYVMPTDAECVTVKLRNLAEYGDVLLIPTSKGWNGLARDEYILVDVLAPRGNNVIAWSNHRPNESHCPQGGVRIYHVDARSYVRSMITDEKGIWLDDYEGYDRSNPDIELSYSYSNTTLKEPNYFTDLSPDPSIDYRFLWMINSDKSNMTKYFKTDYLFEEGQSFTMEEYQMQFPNYPLADNGYSLNYRITVDSYDPDTAEAVVTVTKLD